MWALQHGGEGLGEKCGLGFSRAEIYSPLPMESNSSMASPAAGRTLILTLQKETETERQGEGEKETISKLGSRDVRFSSYKCETV